MKKVSAIIPCYNEQEALPYFLKEIRLVADRMSATYLSLVISAKKQLCMLD